MEAQEALKPHRGKLLLWASGGMSLGLFLAMVVHSSPLSPAIPALQLTFTEAEFKAILAQWGSEGIARFRVHLRIDFLVLASYGLFGYLLVRQSNQFNSLGTISRRVAAAALPLAATLDAVENLLHIELLSGQSGHAPALYLVAGMVSTGKWVLIASFVIAVLYLFFRQGRNTGDKLRHR